MKRKKFSVSTIFKVLKLKKMSLVSNRDRLKEELGYLNQIVSEEKNKIRHLEKELNDSEEHNQMNNLEKRWNNQQQTNQV